jgi:mono/diheme cytochrome c family protein
MQGALAIAATATMLLVAANGRTLAAHTTPAPRAMLDRGRMLVAYGGCNECHTPGWSTSDGRVAESLWMTGSGIGFRGPWGTVYPANVRLWFQQTSEADWLHAVATRGGHPPMKWTDLRMLTVDDRRAIYRFIHALGPAGTPAPLSVPPGREPTTPYIDVIPHPGGSP